MVLTYGIGLVGPTFLLYRLFFANKPRSYLLTYLHTYLLTYLLTYLRDQASCTEKNKDVMDTEYVHV